jgi:hypothetical protein
MNCRWSMPRKARKASRNFLPRMFRKTKRLTQKSLRQNSRPTKKQDGLSSMSRRRWPECLQSPRNTGSATVRPWSGYSTSTRRKNPPTRPSPSGSTPTVSPTTRKGDRPAHAGLHGERRDDVRYSGNERKIKFRIRSITRPETSSHLHPHSNLVKVSMAAMSGAARVQSIK